jgi:hypothetical protein
METVLNVIWLAVALAALWMWRYRWRASRPNSSAHKWAEGIALGCALALLFPVISLTDDLHPETVAIDGSSGKRSGRQLLAAASCGHSPAQKFGTHAAVAVLPSAFASVELVGGGTIVSVVDLYFTSHCARCGGRSPPVSIL